ARVEVMGLAAGEINDRRQLVEPYVRCRDWKGFQIMSPPGTSEQSPQLTPDRLLPFQASEPEETRVRLAGDVLASFAPSDVFLRAEGMAAAVRLKTAVVESLSPGDRLEVFGFPEMGKYSASLVDAEILVHEEGQGPGGLPREMGTEELIQGRGESDLIAVTGLLSDWYRSEVGGILIMRMESGKTPIQVRVPELPSDLAVGMELRAIGICQAAEAMRGGQYRAIPGSIFLRARSADDIRILQVPPWWTVRRLMVVLVALGVMVCLAVLWILLLQRQVKGQTEALRSRIERESALEERQRLAREFHDTLEQDLTGLALRLDAVAAQEVRDPLSTLLRSARSLVSRIQEETRSLVADLREPAHRLIPLGPALHELTPYLEPVGPKISIQVAEGVPVLPSRTVHHVKMIAREAVTNALKHAQAAVIEGKAEVENGILQLWVRDDGKGFEMESKTKGMSGHFGCMGMRERARKVGATIEWTREQSWTYVRVTLPVDVNE
ncbi:MAG: sensor histidine kinase, partial [Verrucomicrobiota bacterium]